MDTWRCFPTRRARIVPTRVAARGRRVRIQRGALLPIQPGVLSSPPARRAVPHRGRERTRDATGRRRRLSPQRNRWRDGLRRREHRGVLGIVSVNTAAGSLFDTAIRTFEGCASLEALPAHAHSPRRSRTPVQPDGANTQLSRSCRRCACGHQSWPSCAQQSTRACVADDDHVVAEGAGHTSPAGRQDASLQARLNSRRAPQLAQPRCAVARNDTL